MKQFEQNVISSFHLARKDINELYENVKFILEQVAQLKQENAQLAKKLNKKTVKKTVAKKYVASKTGSKVHSPGCVFAKNIKQKNKVIFSNKTKALNEGLKLCNCLAY
tara:strand:+ start:130 stop:453 length:324 start_codon:yes stop_codon:yes gene_type:complete